MRKFLFLSSIMMLLSTRLLADNTVLFKPDTDLVINAVTDQSFPLIIDKPSGDSTDENSAVEVYLPVNGVAALGGALQLYFSKSATLPSVSSTTDKIQFPLYINVDAPAALFLYAAVKQTSGSNYKVIKKFSETRFTGSTTQEITFNIIPKDICTYIGADCAFATTGDLQKEYMVYFFLTNTSLGNGASFEISTYPNGLYANMKMSNKVYDTADTPDVHTALADIRTGDGRLFLSYTSDYAISDAYALKVYRHSGPATGQTPIGSATGGLLAKDLDYSYTANDLQINDLINNTDYYLSVTFVDKYLFATKLSNVKRGTPLQIQELLKANQCFLLTAGFGENHFVIEYFRDFRDQVLSKFTLGQMFIKTYYELAPKYALAIYQHEYIRLGIRMFSYALYYLFHYFYLVILLAVASGSVLLYRKSKKNKLEWL